MRQAAAPVTTAVDETAARQRDEMNGNWWRRTGYCIADGSGLRVDEDDDGDVDFVVVVVDFNVGDDDEGVRNGWLRGGRMRISVRINKTQKRGCESKSIGVVAGAE